MEKLTREQINARLEKLRQSRFDEDPYADPDDLNSLWRKPPSFAMCYMTAIDDDFFDETPKTEKVTCENCGVSRQVLKKTFDSAMSLVNELNNAGLVSKLVYNCPHCATQYHKAEYEIWIKTIDDSDWNVTVPYSITSCKDDDKNVVYDDEYHFAVKFLTEKTKSKDLSYPCLYPEYHKNTYGEYHENIYDEDDENIYDEYHENTYGEYKLKIDSALHKVLKLDIIFDLNELKKNIEIALNWDNYNSIKDDYRHDPVYWLSGWTIWTNWTAHNMQQVNKLLARSKKQSYTYGEYLEFMKKIDEIRDRPTDYVSEIISDIIYESTKAAEPKEDCFKSKKQYLKALAKFEDLQHNCYSVVGDGLIRSKQGYVSKKEIRARVIAALSSESISANDGKK